MAFDTDTKKPEKKKHKKLYGMMTLTELRGAIDAMRFEVSELTSQNANKIRYMLDMPIDRFSQWYKRNHHPARWQTAYERAGAMRNGAILIPTDWGDRPLMYDALTLRIEEHQRIMFARQRADVELDLDALNECMGVPFGYDHEEAKN